MFSINVTNSELDSMMSILWTLNQPSDPMTIRKTVLPELSKLFNAEFVASFILSEDNSKSTHGVYLNIDDKLHEDYCSCLYKTDSITPKMRSFSDATIVNDVFSRRDLLKTAHYNEFLLPNNMYNGLNVFLTKGLRNLGDFRIWRSKGEPDFSQRDVKILQALSPYFEKTLNRNSLKFESLTSRENEVINFIAHGLSDKEIATCLHISHTTVRTHVKHILEKLSCKNRTELAIQFYT